MISFTSLVLHKKEAVYHQICRFVKQQILIHAISNYDELPSRRELAMTLSINPNTVQKAYKQLEEEGIIHTISNVKSVIVVNDEILSRIQSELIEEDMQNFVKNCKDNGMDFQQTIALLSKYW